MKVRGLRKAIQEVVNDLERRASGLEGLADTMGDSFSRAKASELRYAIGMVESLLGGVQWDYEPPVVPTRSLDVVATQGGKATTEVKR